MVLLGWSHVACQPSKKLNTMDAIGRCNRNRHEALDTSLEDFGCMRYLRQFDRTSISD